MIEKYLGELNFDSVIVTGSTQKLTFCHFVLFYIEVTTGKFLYSMYYMRFIFTREIFTD